MSSKISTVQLVLSQRSQFKSQLPANPKNNRLAALARFRRHHTVAQSTSTSHLLTMSLKDPSAIPSITKRRGVIRSSITRLANRLSIIENSDTCGAAQQTLQRLNDLQAEFKVLHFELIDLIEEEKVLEKEQEIFDTVDEQVDDTKIHIKKIIRSCNSATETSKDDLFFVTRKLSTVKGNMVSIKAGIQPLTGKDDEIHLIRQYEEEISEMKRELSHIYDSLLQLKLDESHNLCANHSTLKGEIFESSLKLKELSHKIAVAASETVGSGVRLSKLETPRFDGNLLN